MRKGKPGLYVSKGNELHQQMNILIYEPLPDANRAPFIRNLYKAFEKMGANCTILTEYNVIYTLNAQMTPKGVLDNTFPLNHYFQNLCVRVLPHEKALYKNVNDLNLGERVEIIRQKRRDYWASIFKSLSPNRIFIWNGNHDHQQDFIEFLKSTNQLNKLFFSEMGWLPQKAHFYLDSEGINGSSSIAKHQYLPLTDSQTREVQAWKSINTPKTNVKEVSKRVLVPLQIDTDTNITHFSKFSSMQDFLNFLSDWIPADYQVIVRPHPLAQGQLNTLLIPNSFQVNSEDSLMELISSAEIVVGINSTTLIESALMGKKVIACGSGIFDSYKGIVNICRDAPPKFTEVEYCLNDLDDFLHYLIFSKQIRFDTLEEETLTNFKQALPFAIEESRLGHSNDTPLLRTSLLTRLISFLYCSAFHFKQKL